MRTCSLLLALWSGATHGFTVTSPVKTAVTPTTLLFGASTPPNDGVVGEDSVQEDLWMMTEESAKATTTPEKDLVKDTLAMIEESLKDVDYEELQEKAATVWKDLSAKAKDFAEDERVQEIAAKAKEFATDTMDQIFSTAKEKLQEWSDAKESSKVIAGSSTVDDMDDDATNDDSLSM